jgi:SHS2 domain-containing protein
MKYRLIDHTADFGVHVFGTNPKDLFANAALAMFNQITDTDALKGTGTYHLDITGADWPDLMVNWLRELLFLWTGKEMLIKKVDILSIAEDKLSAKARFDLFVLNRHEIKNEIKAVTYHQIQVESGPAGWEAKIIFDV